ncbi:hypothetical protein BBJ29_005806 [Phytophthora kernoviae]|uniref:CSC1/OSCA1-like 7TM region domain-containing protein n=1 Tax=Phytophthora kernoviae TaxID=325452 RepID=A0A3F2RQE5_9STRA|nr:hypothetical protein BBP00_00004904 [Phytophthora kernoviae]RLN64037.1 hypothetical protein BBJ29_005806 [Phytophthora kernoviae]
MTTQQDAAAANANPSGTLKTSVSIYFPILVIGLLLFEVLRRRYRRAYDSRHEEESALYSSSFNAKHYRDRDRDRDGLFCWIAAGFRVSDEELLERCGLDTLTFLRFLRFGQKLALLAVGCSALATLNEEVARELQSIEDTQTQLATQVEEQEREMGSFDDSRHVQLRQSQEILKRGNEVDSKEAPLLAQRSPVEREQRLRNNLGGDSEDDLMDEKKARRHEREMNQEEREQVRKEHPIRIMRRSAFISFTSLMSAQVAQQTLQSKDPVCMAVMPAPHASDINWDNIGLRYRTRTLGTLVSLLISGTIVLFWTIPTAFVASLATVESLRRALPFLNKAFDEYPLLEAVFKQIAPLALVGLSALAPIVFRFLSNREGHPSNTEARAALFTKLAYFQLVQTFFVTVVVGTILNSLKEILDKPKVLVSMLGRSMPQQSTFFISYVIIFIGLRLTLELLQAVPLLLSTLYALFAPRHTSRERNSPWLGLRDIAQTDPFDPTSTLADCFLVLLVTLTFAPIAPLVCYFTWFFFFMAEVVYRRQVLCVYKPMVFAYGAFWPRLYKFCIIGLVVAQLTLIGLLSLKKASAPVIAVVVLVVIVLLFNYFVITLYPPVAKYLPLMQCVRLDSERGLHDAKAPQFFFLDNVYRQPAMNEKAPIRADYRMLVSNYDEDTSLSPEIYSAEDQRLFTSVV